jgi:hypothetical protein
MSFSVNVLLVVYMYVYYSSSKVSNIICDAMKWMAAALLEVALCEVGGKREEDKEMEIAVREWDGSEGEVDNDDSEQG